MDEISLAVGCLGSLWVAAGKHMVSSIYQRKGRVQTFPIASGGNRDLVSLMTNHTKAGSLYYIDDWHAYTFLDIRDNHVVIGNDNGKSRGTDHINGIKGF